jgi:hypothetical protein
MLVGQGERQKVQSRKLKRPGATGDGLRHGLADHAACARPSDKIEDVNVVGASIGRQFIDGDPNRYGGG